MVTIDGKEAKISVVDCGELTMPSGHLTACDPFAGMEPTGSNTIFAKVEPGKYLVKVTVVDLSDKGDGPHIREAYASLILEDGEVLRKPMVPVGEAPDPADDEFFGIPVDTGTACFVDDKAITPGMGDADDWYDNYFENDDPNCWFNRMDDEEHIRGGIASIRLPNATNGSNLILFHSGWGDGFFPIVGGYNTSGKLVAVHIDFQVLGDD